MRRRFHVVSMVIFEQLQEHRTADNRTTNLPLPREIPQFETQRMLAEFPARRFAPAVPEPFYSFAALPPAIQGPRFATPEFHPLSCGPSPAPPRLLLRVSWQSSCRSCQLPPFRFPWKERRAGVYAPCPNSSTLSRICSQNVKSLSHDCAERNRPIQQYPQGLVTHDLASSKKMRRSLPEQGDASERSLRKGAKWFRVKILTSKSLIGRILQTLFAKLALVAAFQGGRGEGIPRLRIKMRTNSQIDYASKTRTQP